MAKKKSIKKNNNLEKIENKQCFKHSKILKILVLGLLILNVVLSLSILIKINSNQSTTNSIDNSRFEKMESKINAIDNFFAKNVQGYNSGANPTGGADSQIAKTDISSDDDPFIGNTNAKVTVIEFSDYQCPFCRKFWTESYSQIKLDYIDTNKIKYVFRDFPLGFHKGAIPAAIAGNCIREQLGNEGYFKYHDIAFTEQNKITPNTVDVTENMIMTWVSQISGLDKTKFDTCFKDPTQKAEVEADLADGAKAGVSGTPSFFINGKLIVGAQPYSVIKAEIEKALNS